MLLDTASFLVREKAGLGSALADTYELFDADNGAAVGVATERPTLSVLRWLLSLNCLPTRIEISETGRAGTILTLRKRWSLRRGYFELRDGEDRLVAVLYTPWFSHLLFKVEGPEGIPLGELGIELEGAGLADLVGWRRRLLDGAGRPIGIIEKEWAGAARELLTSADHYRVTVAPDSVGRHDRVALLLAACLVNDLLRTEQR